MSNVVTHLMIDQVSFYREDAPLFSPISLTLYPGELLQITGNNGCGKSTLLRLIAGLLTPESGQIRRPTIHYIGHTNGIRNMLTARENLQLTAALWDTVIDDQLIESILQQAGILKLADIRAIHFSAGEARRLALSRLLLRPAALWLLDEPATALDLAGQHWLNALIEAQLAQKGMVIIAKHLQLEENTPQEIQFNNKSLSFSLQKEKKLAQIEKIKKSTQPLIQTSRQVKNFFLLLRLEITSTLREAAAWSTPLFFFIMAMTFFALATGNNSQLLHQLAGSFVWVTTLLAILLSIDSLFRQDAKTGYIDQILCAKESLIWPITYKILAHWLTCCLPLILISPLAGSMLGLSVNELRDLFLSLLCGTPILSMTGAVGAALVANLRSQGLLLPILIMPFYIPPLIFGTGIMTASLFHQPILPLFAFMGALVLLALLSTPWLTALALRTGTDQ